MADKAISELTRATSIKQDDMFVAEQDGVAKQVTGSVFEKFVKEAVNFSDIENQINTLSDDVSGMTQRINGVIQTADDALAVAQGANSTAAAAKTAAEDANQAAVSASQAAAEADRWATEAHQTAAAALPKSGGTISGNLKVTGQTEAVGGISTEGGITVLSSSGGKPGEGVALDGYYDSDGVPVLEIRGSFGDEAVRLVGIRDVNELPGYIRTAAQTVAGKILGVTGEKTVYEEGGSGYTNRLPISVDTSGGTYNTVGYKSGYRINSSGVEKQITESYFDTSVCVTGFIPCVSGDIIRLSGMEINPADPQAASYNIAVYDTSFSKLAAIPWETVGNHATVETDEDGHITSITLTSTLSAAGVAYIRLSAKNITADSIVTVNEEIGGGTVAVDKSRVPFNLAFVTDIHWNDPDQQRVQSVVQALGVITETAPVDALVFGGDYIHNWAAITAAAAKEDIANCRKMFADVVTTPTLWLRGNHDCNPYPDARLTKAEIFSRVNRAQNTLPGFVSNPQDPYGCYGYMDFENAKIRLVTVNTSDNDEFGMIALDESGYSALLDAYNISAKQLQWIADHALDLSGKADPGDWGIIFVSHVPIYSTNSWHNSHTYTDADGNTWTCNVVNLADLVKAYQDKTSFSVTLNGETVSKDFSGVSTIPQILGFVSGHKHAMLETTYNGFSFVSCPNACNAGEKVSDDGSTYTKTAPGTAGETAFSVLTFDVSNKKIYSWVYGAGYDRVTTL